MPSHCRPSLEERAAAQPRVQVWRSWCTNCGSALSVASLANVIIQNLERVGLGSTLRPLLGSAPSSISGDFGL